MAAAVNRIDRTGQKFGRLTVLSYSHTARRTPYWLCRCECGTVRPVHGGRLSRGMTRSCGCLAGETDRAKLPSAWAGRARATSERRQALYEDIETVLWRGKFTREDLCSAVGYRDWESLRRALSRHNRPLLDRIYRALGEHEGVCYARRRVS